MVWFQLWFKSISLHGALARRGATLEDGRVTIVSPRQATHPATYVQPPPNNLLLLPPLLPPLEYRDGRLCNTMFIEYVGDDGTRWEGGSGLLIVVDVLQYAVKLKLGKLGVGKFCWGTCTTFSAEVAGGAIAPAVNRAFVGRTIVPH